MNPDEPRTSDRWERLAYSYYWIYIVLVPLLVIGAAIVVMSLAVAPPPTTSVRNSPRVTESGLETARQGLTRQTDLNACHNALQQINAELGDKAARRPPSLTEKQKTWLRDNLRLNDEELNEVERGHYTRLDNHHLFRCFLMGDVAHDALAVKGARGQAGGAAVREEPLDQAARAFAWTMRQVRLRPGEGEAIPSSYVVRRGWGTALERALVFLALLEQLGDPGAPQPELLGFLLYIPNDSGGTRLWACGVVAGDGKDVYLFDPHLGLPLPGPKGEGIATLAEVRQQPEILAQLNVDPKYDYPVTAEQAGAAQAQLVCPLSALSPRMRFLQEKLLAPALRVRLAADAAADLKRVQAACAAGANKSASGGRKPPVAPVVVSRDHCTLLRRFLPVDEGGADAAHRLMKFQLALVPWNVLPPWFRNEATFPQKSELGNRVRSHFASLFIYPTMEAGQPRDLLLRGRYSSAVPALVSERAHWRDQLVQRANAVDLQEKAEEWLELATKVYARKYRAKQPREREQAEQQVEAMWRSRDTLPIYVLLNSAAAAARDPEAAYQLGLCSQEQAEQLQARLDLQTRVGAAPHQLDVERAKSNWRNALNAWKRFEEDYPRNRDVAAARRLRGRAEAMLGDHQAAIASWKDVSGFPTDLEKLASLYLAHQWEKKHSQ